MSMYWSYKMRAMYITGFIILLLLAITPSVYKYLTKPATCHDGIQNQGESAPDLGGPCHYLSEYDVRPLIVRWARSFEVVPGRYSAVAYVENPNHYAGIVQRTYEFNLYDSEGVLVATREGHSFIPAGKIIPIFESGIEVGGRVPTYTLLKFTDRPIWERMDPSLMAKIKVSDEYYKVSNSIPKLTASIKNDSVYKLENVVVVATLFDTAGNAIASSRTIVDKLPPDSTKKIVFTWPKPFKSFVASVDVIPLLPPPALR